MTNSTSTETVVYHEEHTVDHRLKALGLSLAGLLDVVRRGENARAEATENDPVNAAGTDAYRYRVRGLRDVFVQGWSRRTLDGLELLWRDDGEIAVMTRGGNDAVGYRDSFPQPHRSVGDSTKHAVAAQLSLDPNWFNDPTADSGGTKFYMLLVNASITQVRAELSLPSGVEDGEVRGWVERIILPAIDLGDVPVFAAQSEPMPIEVPVTRKR